MQTNPQPFLQGGKRAKNSGSLVRMSRKLLTVAILLLSFISVRSHGQGCLTNSLIINTGYDPATGGAYPSGCNGCTPQHDPKWMVTNVTANVASAIYTSVGGPFIPSAPYADVVDLAGGWADPAAVGQNANWINPLNANYYSTASNVDSPNNVYSTTFTRYFYLCGSDSINFDLHIADDNFLAGLFIDGVLYYSQSAGCGWPCINTFANPAIPTLFLSSGMHRIDAVVTDETNSYYNSYNYTGLCIYGTVSSATGANSIVSDNTGCDSTACNTKHPCADSSNISVASLPGAPGCSYEVTANVSTVYSILGYQWSGSGSAVIHHNHGYSDNYTVTVAPGDTVTLTCVVYIVDTNFTDSTGPCCQVVLTQTLTCTDTVKKECCFDSTNTFLSFTSATTPVGCQFTVTAHQALLQGCKFAGYIWQSPGYTSGIVTWNPYALTLPPATSAVVTVTFLAVDINGDTCKVTRSVMLNCGDTPPPTDCCFDSTNTYLSNTVMTTPAGVCMFTVTAHQLLLKGCNFIGYIWTGPGGYNSGLVPWNTYSPPPTPPATSTWVTVTYIAVNSNGDTCKVTRTIYLSCNGHTTSYGCCFDSVNTFLTYTVSSNAAGCMFTVTAHRALLPGCQFVGYIWTSVGGYNSGIVPWNVYTTPTVAPMTSTWVTVTFIAVNGAGDTCKVTRTIYLDCNGGKPKAAHADGGINIFPNPTNSAVTITSATDDINSIQVIDVNGKKVGDFSYKHTKTTDVSLSQLPPGTYMFKVNETVIKVISKIQ